MEWPAFRHRDMSTRIFMIDLNRFKERLGVFPLLAPGRRQQLKSKLLGNPPGVREAEVLLTKTMQAAGLLHVLIFPLFIPMVIVLNRRGQNNMAAIQGMLPHILRSFASQHPQVLVEVLCAPTPRLVERLRKHTLDLALVSTNEPAAKPVDPQ